MALCRPHDLLRLSPGTMQVPSGAPAWVRVALSITPWVVVRRAEPPAGRIPVGIRGPRRSQRFAAEITAANVAEIVTPETLAGRQLDDSSRPIARALRVLQDDLAGRRLAWGPTGSVGFQLATGAATVTAESDLDLIIRVPDPIGSALARPILADLTDLAAGLVDLPVRADCQVETPDGAFSLSELVAPDARQLVLRTRTGPKLVGHPRSTHV